MDSCRLSLSIVAVAAALGCPRPSAAQYDLPPPDPPAPPESSPSTTSEEASESLQALIEPSAFEVASAPAPAQPALPEAAPMASTPPATMATAPVAAAVPAAVAAAGPAAVAGAARAPARRSLEYGRGGLSEFGGALALTHESETTAFRLTPSAGYFVFRNFEISVLPELRVMHIDDPYGGVSDVSLGAALEASYHLPVTKQTFVSGGLGLGVRYANDPGFGSFLRTRLGLDVPLGSAGVLKPAAFIDMGFEDGVTAGGIEAGFTLLL